MKVIVRPRQMGKTTELLKYAQENDCMIVTHSYDSSRILERQAKSMGYTIISPISYTCLTRDRLHGVKGIVIDNAELVLASMLGYMSPILGLTISGIPEIEYDPQRDADQWEDFRRTNPSLTFQEFCSFKYNMDIGD